MRKQKNLYLKKYRILFVSLLFFLLFLNVISATATWEHRLNDVNMEYNQHIYMMLQDWCSNCNYFWITFRNPDNGVQVIGAKSSIPMTYENSYFKFKIDAEGRIDIYSKEKNLDEQFSVYAGEGGLAPDIYQYFYIHIRGMLAPTQIKSLPNPINLEGNNSRTESLSNYFIPYSEPHPDGYTHIKAEWSNSILVSSIYQTGRVCDTNAGINICLQPNGINDIVMSIRGINQTSNKTLQITAYNVDSDGHVFRSTKGNPITIHTIKSGNYLTPFRTLYPISPVHLGFNESAIVGLDLYWKNITYVNITFVNTTTGNNVTLTSNPNFPAGSSGGKFPEFFITTTWNAIAILSSETNYNFPVYIKACNTAGCNSDDNILYVNILGEVPVFNPMKCENKVSDIVMNYNQYKAFDVREIYGNINYTNLTWYDNYNSWNLTIPIGVYENCSTSFVLSHPSYEICLTFSNLIVFVSGNNDTNFVINMTACNSEGCAENCPIRFYVIGSKNPEVVSQVNSSFWSSTTQTFLNIYPDNEGLSLPQKVGVIVISMAVLSILIMFFLNNTEITSSTKMYAVMFLNSLLFVFFLVKGYVGVVVPAIIALFVLLMIYFKSRGGGD